MAAWLAEARLALAEAELACGEPAAALAAAERAAEDFGAQRRPGWAALAEHTAVRSAFAQGSRDAALHARARRAARALSAAGWPAAALDAQLLAAHVALALGRGDDVARDLSAITRARDCGPVAQRLGAWHAEALRRLAGGRRAGALRALRAGLAVLERHRLSLGATELRAAATVHGNALASLGLRLALESGRAESVLEWAERGRAGALWQRPARPPDDAALAADLGELRTVLAAIGDAGKESEDTQRLLRRQTELEGAIRRRALHAAAGDGGGRGGSGGCAAAGAVERGEGAAAAGEGGGRAGSGGCAAAGAVERGKGAAGGAGERGKGAAAGGAGERGEGAAAGGAGERGKGAAASGAGERGQGAAGAGGVAPPRGAAGAGGVAPPRGAAGAGGVAPPRGDAGAGGPPKLAVLRAALGSRALVEFVHDGAHLRAVVVLARSAPRLVALGATADEVGQELAALRAALRRLARGVGSAASKAVARSNAEHAARRLDDLLLAPLAELCGERELVLVPTGELHAVPWAALPSCAARALSVAPSAALWLRAARGRGRGGGRAVADEGGADGAAATRIDEDAAGTGGGADAGGRRGHAGLVLAAGPGLPEAAAEVRALARRHPHATVLAPADASVAAVAAALETSQLAHIASHGTFRADNPLFSSLELADGPLTVYDLERLRAAPRDMVLSACDGGVTAVRPGDELMGLSSALLALGTSALIASVMPVPDEPTHRLMLALHERLAAGDEPACALAAARATALGDDDADYATAAGFVCFGAGSATSTHDD